MTLVVASSLVVSCRTVQVDPKVSNMFYDLNLWKSQCEQWAVIIHRDFPRDNVSFRKGEALYIEANAAANAWIDQLRFDLDTASGIYSDNYKKSLSEAQRTTDRSVG